MTREAVRQIRHAQEPDVRLRADPDRLADLVLLHRQGRRAGAGRACAADRAHPADPVHVSGRTISTNGCRRSPTTLSSRSISASASIRSSISISSSSASRSMRRARTPSSDFIVGLLMFLLVMELSRLAHPVLFWTNVVLVVYTLWGYLSPIDFFWHPGTIVLSRHHVEHGRTVDRHLRPLRPARAHLNRGLPAARRRRERLRGAARDDQRGAHHRRTLAAAHSADRGRGVECDRHDQRLGLGQRRRGRHHHHPADDPLRRSRHVCRGGRDLGLDGRPDHAADDGGRRVPDVGISRRSLLGRGGARLLRSPSSTTSRSASPSISCACGLLPRDRDRAAGRSDLRQGQDHDLPVVGALPALPHGLCRQGRTDRRALHRDLHVSSCWSRRFSTSSTS